MGKVEMLVTSAIYQHGMNSVSDLYASKRKGCRKKSCYIVYNVIFSWLVPLLLYVGYHNCFMLPNYCTLMWCWLFSLLGMSFFEVFTMIYYGFMLQALMIV